MSTKTQRDFNRILPEIATGAIRMEAQPLYRQASLAYAPTLVSPATNIAKVLLRPVRFRHPAVRNRTPQSRNLRRHACVYLLDIQLLGLLCPIRASNCHCHYFRIFSSLLETAQ